MRPVAQRIAIVGFSAFERRTLESYFRLVDAVPVYTVDGSVAECDWLVADADQPEAVYTVGQAGRVRDTVFIGGSKTPATAGAHLSRPIDAMQLRRALDDLKNRRAARALRESGLTPRLRLAATGPSGLTRQQALNDHEVQDFRASSGYSNAVLADGDQRLDQVLVVSNSPAECRMLRERLMAFGYRVLLTRTSDEAVALTGRLVFGFVFLGMGQGGSAGFQTCRRIRRHPTLVGLAPVVVALAGRHAPIERIRATFADCDACLGTPLEDTELAQLLARHDRTFDRVFQPTALMSL
jgi:two-component system, cell cycle response regulator